jgi:hypothetical protein
MIDQDLIPPKARRALRIAHPVVWTGFYTGALLIIVMLASLVAANRLPGLEPYALERNAVSFCLFGLFMLIPIVRFWDEPLKMFASAIIGWLMFVAAYDVAGMIFRNLAESLRHDPFLALVEGSVLYALCAAIFWVGEMILHARHHPIAPGRKHARHGR